MWHTLLRVVALLTIISARIDEDGEEAQGVFAGEANAVLLFGLSSWSTNTLLPSSTLSLPAQAAKIPLDLCLQKLFPEIFPDISA